MVTNVQLSSTEIFSCSNSSSITTQEVAKERTKIGEVWRKLELAKGQVVMLKSMQKANQRLNQVDAIISNVGRTRKSRI